MSKYSDLIISHLILSDLTADHAVSLLLNLMGRVSMIVSEY